MAFRNVIIDSRCKLEYSLNYLICKKQDEEKRIVLDEIRTIVITSTQVAITSSLICMLSKKKIKVIFCDYEHNPECELTPFSNNFYTYRKIKEQMEFIKNNKYLWKRIIEKKINNQAYNLKYAGLIDSYNLLMQYKNDVLENDISNREGHSAKVYFNSLFGVEFSRRSKDDINKYLNYGYAILVSTINRELKALGYLTEFGIHHIGESNSFNFSYDLIEPIRPLVDLYVIKKIVNDDNFKSEFVKMLTLEVIYNNRKVILDNAIHLYVNDMILYLKTSNEDYIKFINYEL